MPIGNFQGGGHIDTPYPATPPTKRPPRKRIDTPDPVHETPVPDRPAPEPTHWLVRLRANPCFYGRNALLQTIHDAVMAHGACHLYGPIASGTTQTALAYAYQARASFDAIFWLTANDSVSFRFDITRCGDELGLATQEEKRHGERIESTLNWLTTHEHWLLIADGIDDPAILNTLLPAATQGKLLLTGHVHLDEPALHRIDHAPLDEASALDFLYHRSQQITGGEKLLHLLGGMALPLHLAAAYCHATKTPLSDYANRIEKAYQEIDEPAEAHRTSAVVELAVAESLKYLSETNPAALEMIALCAQLDTDEIPLVTLYDGAPFLPKRLSACVTNPEALNQVLALLYRLGLVQFSQNSVAVHPLIQRATSRLLGRPQRIAWTRTALRVVLEAFPVETPYIHPIPACSILLRHAFAITRRSEQIDNLRESTGTLLNQVGLYLHACEELPAARSCFERAIHLAEILHETDAHPTVAARVNSLGVVLQDQGAYAEARDCYRRAFQLCEAVYGPARDATMGPAHRSMLTMPRRNLCQVLELMGDIPAAQKAYQDAIDTFMEVYCWNHSLVAESMNGLGLLFQQNGEHVKAQQCFLKAIQAEENAEESQLGAAAQYTRNLAHALLETDKVEEARKFFEQALIYDREDFGPAHETVAVDLQGLARTHRMRSRFEEAHACLDEALLVWNALSSTPTPAKAFVWRQKGRCYLDACDDEAAIGALQHAIALTERWAGEYCTGLGPDLVYLGRAFSRLEKYEDAEEALLRALLIHEKESWLDDDAIRVLYSRLVRVFRAQQNFSQAAYFQKLELEAHERNAGPEDDRVAADAYSLGNLYIALERLDEARHYLQRAQDIYTLTRGEDDERTERVRRKCAAVDNLRRQAPQVSEP